MKQDGKEYQILTEEEKETREALLRVYAPQQYDAGYFYCPYNPFNDSNETEARIIDGKLFYRHEK